MDAGHNALGKPVAYSVIGEGTAVYEPGGERIGVVDEVLADETDDIFYGVLVHTVPLPGRHLYAGAEQIAGLYERGVLLAVGRDLLREPWQPRRSRAGVDGTVASESRLEAWLRRAWDWITQRSGSG